MRVFGVIGWKNSGKTHLMVRLVSEITSRGFSVSTIKHAHHTLEFNTRDAEGREMRPAGVREAVFASPSRWSLVRETEGGQDEPLSDLLGRLKPVDLVLVEGYKRGSHPKIEAWRGHTKRELIARADAHVVAIASKVPVEGMSVPVLDLDDTAAIADFVLRFVGLGLRQEDVRRVSDH